MRRALRRLIIAEVVLAVHLSAVGTWWAALAARRLGKFSAKVPGAATVSGPPADTGGTVLVFRSSRGLQSSPAVRAASSFPAPRKDPA